MFIFSRFVKKENFLNVSETSNLLAYAKILFSEKMKLVVAIVFT